MILATLLLILAVLLFGTGVVKGFLANAAALGCGGIVIIGLAIWVGSFFGENGLLYIFFGGAALLLAFAILDRIHTAALNYTPPRLPREKKFHGSTPTKEERKRIKADLRQSGTYSIQDPSYDDPLEEERIRIKHDFGDSPKPSVPPLKTGRPKPDISRLRLTKKPPSDNIES